jgi:glutamyl-tRNA synthetase
MILGPDRSKLSKRHGATSVTEYMEAGYLPEAMFNFLALLGWSLDDKTEVMSRDVIIRNFSLERISKNPAVFNKEKLDWMNGVYIRSLTVEEFTRRALPFLERGLSSTVARPLDQDYVRRIMPLVQDRARTLGEVAHLTEFFFAEELNYEAKLFLEKLTPDEAAKSLQTTIARLEGLQDWDAATLENLLRPLAEELQLKTGVYFGLLRVAVTGRTAAPPLFQTMEVLGKNRCLKRLRNALSRVSNVG